MTNSTFISRVNSFLFRFAVAILITMAFLVAFLYFRNSLLVYWLPMTLSCFVLSVVAGLLMKFKLKNAYVSIAISLIFLTATVKAGALIIDAVSISENIVIHLPKSIQYAVLIDSDTMKINTILARKQLPVKTLIADSLSFGAFNPVSLKEMRLEICNDLQETREFKLEDALRYTLLHDVPNAFNEKGNLFALCANSHFWWYAWKQDTVMLTKDDVIICSKQNGCNYYAKYSGDSISYYSLTPNKAHSEL